MNWLTRLLPGAHSTAALSDAVKARIAAWQALPDAPLDQTHADTRYVILNTEATGLDVTKDRLVAVAGIAIENGLLGTQNAYYAATEGDPVEALLGLLEFAGKSPIVIFNGAFNRRVILDACEHVLGIEPELHWIDLYWLLPSVYADKGKDARRLADWMAAVGVETYQRHHALGDCYAIAQLFLAAKARSRAQGLYTAEAILSRAHTRRRMSRPL